MRNGAIVGMSVLLAASVGVAKDKADGRRLSVYLTGGAGLPDDEGARKAADKQLTAVFEAACKASSETQRSLQARHGKKPDAWPAEARAERAKAAAACEVATFDRFYRHSAQKEIDDSLTGLRANLEDDDWIALATGPDDAALVVKVVGRSRLSFKGSWAPYSCLGLEVSPGGKGSADAFLALGAGIETSSDFGPGSRQIATYHPYTTGEPYWLVDGCGQGLRWKMAASGGEVVLRKLASNYGDGTVRASR